MINLNSALRMAIATDYGIMAMMQYGCIKIFSGSQPASADDAEQGELLAVITQDGIPFQWGTGQGALELEPGPTIGACQKQGDWKLSVIQSGTAGWWRFVGNGYDDGGAEVWQPRIDGLVGEGLILPEVNLTASAVLSVESFIFIIP